MCVFNSRVLKKNIQIAFIDTFEQFEYGMPCMKELSEFKFHFFFCSNFVFIFERKIYHTIYVLIGICCLSIYIYIYILSFESVAKTVAVAIISTAYTQPTTHTCTWEHRALFVFKWKHIKPANITILSDYSFANALAIAMNNNNKIRNNNLCFFFPNICLNIVLLLLLLLLLLLHRICVFAFNILRVLTGAYHESTDVHVASVRPCPDTAYNTLMVLF